MAREKLETVAVYSVAVILLGCMIYFLPLLFIGLAAGFALGKYYDKIVAWIDEASDNPFDD